MPSLCIQGLNDCVFLLIFNCFFSGLAECVAEPILSGIQDSVKTETIATCTQPHFDYLGRWEYIYSTQNQTNFPEVSRSVDFSKI